MNSYFVSIGSRDSFKGPIQGDSPEEVLEYLYKKKDCVEKLKQETSAVMFGNDVFEFNVEVIRHTRTEVKLTPVIRSGLGPA